MDSESVETLRRHRMQIIESQRRANKLRMLRLAQHRIRALRPGKSPLRKKTKFGYAKLIGKDGKQWGRKHKV